MHRNSPSAYRKSHHFWNKENGIAQKESDCNGIAYLYEITLPRVSRQPLMAFLRKASLIKDGIKRFFATVKWKNLFLGIKKMPKWY